jgi:hypothetical protein
MRDKTLRHLLWEFLKTIGHVFESVRTLGIAITAVIAIFGVSTTWLSQKADAINKDFVTTTVTQEQLEILNGALLLSIAELNKKVERIEQYVFPRVQPLASKSSTSADDSDTPVVIIEEMTPQDLIKNAAKRINNLQRERVQQLQK